jgi:hypothetical protein
MVEEIRLGLVDIVVLSVVLLFVLGGIKKGFFRGLNHAPLALALVLGVLLTGLVATVILNSDIGIMLVDTVQGALFVDGMLFGFEVGGLDPSALSTSIVEGLLIVVGFVASFILAWLLLAVVNTQLIRLSKQSIIFKSVDVVLGLLLGLVRAAIVVTVSFGLASAVYLTVPSMGLGIKEAIDEFIINDLSLDRPNSFSIVGTIFTTIKDLLESFGVTVLNPSI